ncbi:MAG: hypothetical protein H6651_14725 [Ardenticatenales bacterium]|nr:hypothetical protein [Ardenticatenales bacterium]
MLEIELGSLQAGPHAELIHAIAERCAADETIQAIWVGGSLAAGSGDEFSDVDFRIAVAPGQLDEWVQPDWRRLLPMPAPGGVFMRFGEHALLHHLVLADGTIIDFYVQDTTITNREPQLVVLACRDEAFAEALAGFATAPAPLVRAIDGAAVRQFLVDYWITTHKQLKGLGRRYDYSQFAGLYFERNALLRAWYMLVTGQDIEARMTIHVLGAIHKGLAGQLNDSQRDLLGLPSRTPAETVAAVDAIRTEMADVGRELARRHQFAYPQELETVVQRIWADRKAELAQR